VRQVAFTDVHEHVPVEIVAAYLAGTRTDVLVLEPTGVGRTMVRTGEYRVSHGDLQGLGGGELRMSNVRLLIVAQAKSLLQH
jgi:hypothetical protein